MTITSLPVQPAPFPAPPLPTYGGRRVRWEPWAEQHVVTHIDPACPVCAHPRVMVATGIVDPLPGETFPGSRLKRTRSGHPYSVPIQVPAWPIRQLHAWLCPGCGTLELADSGRGPAFNLDPIDTILCDGCDRLCAAGADLAEARATLVALGGWTAGDDADWDLCPGCNPEHAPAPPPRALIARSAR